MARPWRGRGADEELRLRRVAPNIRLRASPLRGGEGRSQWSRRAGNLEGARWPASGRSDMKWIGRGKGSGKGARTDINHTPLHPELRDLGLRDCERLQHPPERVLTVTAGQNETATHSSCTGGRDACSRCASPSDRCVTATRSATAVGRRTRRGAFPRADLHS